MALHYMEATVPVSQPPTTTAPEGTSLLQLLLILRRRWRLLMVIWVGTVMALGVYTFTTTRIYRPQATLEIQPPTPIIATSESTDAALVSGRLNYDNYYRTQEQILTSPSLIRAAIDALPDVKREYDAKRDPIRTFMELLDIEKVRTSFIMKVGFLDRDGEKAAKIVNTLVGLYIEDASRRLRDLKSGAVEVLSRETLPAIRQKVDDADKALQDFQQETGFIDFEEHFKSLVRGRNAIDGRIIEIRLRRAKLRAELDALSSYGGDGVRGLFNPAFHSTRSLEPLAEERAKVSAELARERKILKDRHPRVLELQEQVRSVDQKIRESIEGTLQALDTDLKIVELEEKTLSEEQGQLDRRISEAGRNLNKYRRLQSELASAKELYNSYLRKHGETSATSSAGLASVRVVDYASVPLVPYKPKVMTNLALAMGLGLFLGLGGMLLTEQLDDRIASSREVEAFIGLEVLAVIPRLEGVGKGQEAPILLNNQASLPEFEAFRGLRAQLLTRLEHIEGGKVLAILSALQSEGKSTISVNLAQVFAMEGRKVLLFDADMRRPSIRPLLGGSQGPGLEHVLRGEVALQNAIQSSQIPGVDVVGAGEGSSSAAELAGSPRFTEALEWARQRYDLVLIDSAPVNLVSESALLARNAHAAILVVREGQTSRGAAQAAVKRLSGMNVRLQGAVVNCAGRRGRGYGYGYGYYYGDRSKQEKKA